MKIARFIFIVLIVIITFCGCTYQSPAKNAVTSETAAQATGKATAPAPTIIPEPVITTAPPAPTSTVNPTAPIASVTPDAQATFTLTEEDFEKLKAPLNILALCAGTNDKYKFESSDQVTEDMLGTFGANLIVYLDLFKPELIEPQDGGFSDVFVKDYALYGIKKGDTRVKNKSYYFPQKGLFEILNSTFGDSVVKRLHIDPAKLYEYPEHSIDYRPIKLQHGAYIFPEPYEYAYDTSTIETDMKFPVDINNNNFLTARAEIMADSLMEFNIGFKVIKNEKSEWGYNITAFNMQKVE